MPKKRPIPLQQEYEYQKQKRSGFKLDQLPSAATGGDREAISKCAAEALVMVEGITADPELTDLRLWLIDVLLQIQNGTEPNEAFGWTQPGKDHRPRNFTTIQKQWLIGQHMAGLLQNRPELSPHEAGEIVGHARGISADTAVDYWKAFKEEG